jgi:ferric enterobactin receptor
MRRLITVFILVNCCFFLYAQQKSDEEDKRGKIIGKVIDSASGKVVDYATVTVYLHNNPTPVNGAITDKKGLFTIAGLAEGSYKITLDFIGYQPHVFDPVVVSSKTPVINLGNILFAKAAEMMQSVTVTASKGIVENKIDKMVYNAEKDITSQGGVATDVLKKVPMVSVDVDGNVELLGNSNIRFLINGKPSSIFGNNLVDALQSIPASQIKSIEVITNPGAKYDAEGTGGIINIILKESKIQGINGNISLSAGSRLENGSFNFNARKGNFGINTYFSGNAQLLSRSINGMNRSSFDTVSKTNDILQQNGNTDFRRNGFETGTGFDWSINSKNDFSGTIGYDNFGNNSHGFSNMSQTQYDSASNLLSYINSVVNSVNHFRGQSLDWSLAYKKTFNKEDQELNILYNSSYGVNKTYYEQYQNFMPGDSTFAGSYSNNAGKDRETDIQVDYTQPVNEKIKIEASGKAVIRRITSNTDAYALNPKTSSYSYDSTLSNTMIYNQNIYAGYAAITFPLFKWLDIKTGLRYERTQINADFSGVDSTNIPSYNTFAPSFVISHSFSNEQTVKISYTRRIQRPGYRSLNPFVNASDPKNITVGNPYLQPEIADHYELGYMKSFEKGGTVNFNLFYYRSDQDIQPYVQYYPTLQVGDSVYTNVAVTSPQNIGVENNYGMNIYGSVPITPKLNVRSNLSFFYRHIINRLEPGNNISSFNYRVNMNVTYQISDNFVAEFFGNFNSPRNEVQGRFPSFTSYNFAARKQLWNKKGSIGFTTTNPFNKYVNQKTELTGLDFVLNSTRQIPYRSFGVSFTYKFGKLKFKKEKEQNPNQVNPDENN